MPSDSSVKVDWTCGKYRSMCFMFKVKMCESNIQTLKSHEHKQKHRVYLSNIINIVTLVSEHNVIKGRNIRKKQNLFNIMQSNTAPSQLRTLTQRQAWTITYLNMINFTQVVFIARLLGCSEE